MFGWRCRDLWRAARRLPASALWRLAQPRAAAHCAVSSNTRATAPHFLPSLLQASVRPVTCRYVGILRPSACESSAKDRAVQRCPIAAHAARESSLCYFVGCHVRYRSLTSQRPLNLLWSLVMFQAWQRYFTSLPAPCMVRGR